MELNEVLVNALAARIKSEDMIVEQVPIPYQEEVEKKLNNVEV